MHKYTIKTRSSTSTVNAQSGYNTTMEFPIQNLKGRKPIYLNSTHFAITEQQARKLCQGKLPKQGFERSTNMQELESPLKTNTNHYSKYWVTQTPVSCRTDLEDGVHWCVYFALDYNKF